MSHNKHVLLTEQVIPRLPRTSLGLDEAYVDQLLSALEDAIDILNGTRQRTFTEISLTNTQEHGNSLRVGTVFSDAGILKIVRTGDVFAAPFSATGTVGSVTISTP